VSYHVTREGGVSRAGGHGFLIDDGGAAAWIALAALRTLVRGLDEEPEAMRATPLADALGRMIGSTRWEDVRAFVYGGVDRGRLGTLARAVAEADAAGDPAAADILRSAGRELARLAHVLIRRHGTMPVALMGGTIGLSPRIREAIQSDLPQGIAIREARMTPAEAAAGLAVQALRTAGAL
jgi:N-acetylglucosamine kinase-like BadF-type ATPase